MIWTDEEEVAETLYGLTGMFTDTSSIDKKTYVTLSDEKETSQVDFTKAKSLDEPAVSVLFNSCLKKSYKCNSLSSLTKSLKAQNKSFRSWE